ncbi:efflux RND transporter periplasmic adaptor subunit [Sandaracinobacter sp. RS1-74]|uniref:efflux RND transporter periplasmic adaptor subunit n=1 Tax=Sandaracinobacteroides sayramensis TaxID=2913411 RepID=UPI001EDAC95C|nr:efflux RND transporter periplasmic adaptor subunit [Sandaracinobacteroides sayramensis]MCG2839369.1 efflux RND transporter periplasmic adaptor subunit [Sandaracinobacteroides sayramensis]
MTRRPQILLLSAALFALTGCSLLGDSGGGGAKGEKGAPKGAAASPPLVIVATAQNSTLIDSVEAVGTARANEQADINSTVTERIAKINFTDGQYVPRGAVIAELVQAEQSATLNQNQARLREAELQLARLKQLQTQGFATKARVDEQQAAVDVARAGTQQANSQIADRVIRAPFSGWLSLRRISPGTVVNAGTTIVTIVDHSKIKLDFTVPETYLPALKPGLEIAATAAAFPGETFRGRISSIDPVLDPVTRSATARAILPNSDLRLRPGMLMTVDIKSPPREALTVPELAVIGEGTGSYVWKVSEDNQAGRANVSAGSRRDGRVEILSGLNAGDRVVSEGTVKLRGPGPVQPTEPKAAKAPAAAESAPTGAAA